MKAIVERRRYECIPNSMADRFMGLVKGSVEFRQALPNYGAWQS
jgi:hypothetical protein